MKRGVPPTERKARTGELTPPGMERMARERSSALRDMEWDDAVNDGMGPAVAGESGVEGGATARRRLDVVGLEQPGHHSDRIGAGLRDGCGIVGGDAAYRHHGRTRRRHAVDQRA